MPFFFKGIYAKKKNILFTFILFLYLAIATTTVYSKLQELRINAGSLSYDQAHEMISNKKVDSLGCKNISNCNLQNGDILMRRYITDRTKFFDMVFNPYYTHTAFYIGNGYIVEAIGSEKNKSDDIIKERLSESDWHTSELNEWIVIRPKYTENQLNTMHNNLVGIADDDNYTFGLPDKDTTKKQKHTYCSYLIYNELVQNKVLKLDTNDTSKIITPDYLFNLLLTDKNTSILGYR